VWFFDTTVFVAYKLLPLLAMSRLCTGALSYTHSIDLENLEKLANSMFFEMFGNFQKFGQNLWNFPKNLFKILLEL